MRAVLAAGRTQASSVTAMMDGIPVPMIGREALLKNKRETARAKDLADAEEIEKTGPAEGGYLIPHQ